MAWLALAYCDWSTRPGRPGSLLESAIPTRYAAWNIKHQTCRNEGWTKWTYHIMLVIYLLMLCHVTIYCRPLVSLIIRHISNYRQLRRSGDVPCDRYNSHITTDTCIPTPLVTIPDQIFMAQWQFIIWEICGVFGWKEKITKQLCRPGYLTTKPMCSGPWTYSVKHRKYHLIIQFI
jgi:hypothetical protein